MVWFQIFLSIVSELMVDELMSVDGRNKCMNDEKTDNMADDMTLRPRFWQRFALEELTDDEWEALCDGCGCCCLIKYLDDDSQDVDYTDVACQLLDCETGYCQDYKNRQHFVPDCIRLTFDKLPQMMWLPQHCAYKRLYLGCGLPDWHYLLTNDKQKTRQAMFASNIGVAGRCISEVGLTDEQIEERVVTWVQV